MRHLRTAIHRRSVVAALLVVAGLAMSCQAQDLKPRRWGHLPLGTNFLAGGYAYTSADIAFDPVLLVENGELDLHSFPVQYIRTFEVAGKSARIDWRQSYMDAQWSGLLDSVPTVVDRSGWSDMSVRFALNIVGAPPLKGEEFAAYRAETLQETIVGVGLIVQFPTGEYFSDKLLNLGTNRFTFRPQIGVVHNRGKWSAELTASTWLYTDNDNFFGGNYLEQNPYYTLQGYVNYTFRPGLWLGGGIGYGMGGKSAVNGIAKNDPRDNLVWGLAFGYPITRQFGLTFTYLSGRTQTPLGADTDTLGVGASVFW